MTAFSSRSSVLVIYSHNRDYENPPSFSVESRLTPPLRKNVTFAVPCFISISIFDSTAVNHSHQNHSFSHQPWVERQLDMRTGMHRFLLALEDINRCRDHCFECKDENLKIDTKFFHDTLMTQHVIERTSQSFV